MEGVLSALQANSQRIDFSTRSTVELAALAGTCITALLLPGYSIACTFSNTTLLSANAASTFSAAIAGRGSLSDGVYPAISGNACIILLNLGAQPFRHPLDGFAFSTALCRSRHRPAEET